MNSAEASSPVSAGTTAVGGARIDLGQLYVLLVVLGAALFMGVLGYLQLSWQALPRFSPLAVVFFILVGILAEKNKISIGKGVEVSAAFLPDFLAATILGPFAAAVVAAGTLPAWFERGNPTRNAFYVSAFTVTSGSTGLVYWLLMRALPSHLMQIIVGGLVSALFYQACNYLLFMPLMVVRRGIGPKDFFDEAFRPFIPFHLFFLFMSLALLFSFDRYGPSSLVLYLLPTLGLVYAFRAFARERDLARSLEQFSLEMAGSMLTALDLKDNYTGQHSAAVALYSYDTAAELRLSSRERALAHLGGLLHDVGKISIPDSILNCPTTLGEADWEVVQGHAGAGQEILSNMTEFEELGRIILHHHERFDGQGYPWGLGAGDIPLVSRIVAIADSYSAMVSERPYSRRREPEEAMAELRSGSRSQFDPYVAEAFLAVLSRGDEDYRRGQKADFRVQFQKVRFLRDIT